MDESTDLDQSWSEIFPTSALVFRSGMGYRAGRDSVPRRPEHLDGPHPARGARRDVSPPHGPLSAGHSLPRRPARSPPSFPTREPPHGDRRTRAVQPEPSTRRSPTSSTSSSARVGEYLDGRVDEDVFRVFRLNQGIYGQRQGGHNQMVRVKVPHGRVTPEQLEMLAYIAETYSRGWGHLTTRQNVQFHFVQLEQTPEVLRLLGVGRPHHRARRAATPCATSWAATSPARARTRCSTSRRGPRRPPAASCATRYAQRLPRKFKINFSGCATDCGQAMFNDVGVDRGRPRTLADGTIEPGFQVFVAGGLGANPHPAQALEEFTAREDLLPTIEACLRTFDHYGNRDNKLRARMKWLVDTMGIDELRERIIKERKFLARRTRLAGRHPRAGARAGRRARRRRVDRADRHDRAASR